eukprot:INCI16892.1.p1 GENE.INCI16892.1~~INCI16892.1.p1  ORF type:complete len:252 (-),score=27.42 INCI16892.1:175-930(-)
MAVYLRYGALAGFTVVLLRTLSLTWSGFFILAYFAAVHALMLSLFVVRKGEFLLGKDRETGNMPLWSYVVWWPFHVVNLATVYGVSTLRKQRGGVDFCTEVVPGWHLGGWYSEVAAGRVSGGVSNIAVVDLTTEFPERLVSEHYCLVPIWDGTAPTVAQFRRATDFVAEHRRHGRAVVVHCAFGVGRSTTMMIAAMRRLGLCESVDEGLALIRKKRSVCKLNSLMRAALGEWERELSKLSPSLVGKGAGLK